MAVAFFAPINRFRNIVITDGGSISSDGGNFTTNGAGVLTVAGIVTTGNVASGTVTWTTTGATQQTLATGNTVTITAGTIVQKTTNAGAVTGIIMPAGTVDGQVVAVENNSANSVTFAAAGTSRVADGASAVIAANRTTIFIWDNNAALWFHT